MVSSIFDDKETGKTLKHPAFGQLQEAVFNGEVKTVVVWKLDRISRRLKDDINLLAQRCEAGVRVVSVTQQSVKSCGTLESCEAR